MKPTWTPPPGFRVIKLRPNGPKPGQSVDAWLYGKSKGHQELMDREGNPYQRIR